MGIKTAWAQPDREPRQAQLDAAKELTGKVLNYKYADTAELRIMIHEDSMSWEGVGGPLKGMRSTNGGLRASKISEGIYFATWVTAEGGEDTVVFNLKDMKAFVYVFTPQKTVFQLDGVIKCCGHKDKCEAPDMRPQSREERLSIWAKNNPGRQGF